MALLAGRVLGMRLPRRDRRLVVVLETDGCFADGVAAATGCRVGRRTLRVEDYGKIVATFVDVEANAALRVAPHPGARARAREFAPGAKDDWHAMLLGYQRMPDELLLVGRHVELSTSLSILLGEPGARVRCEACGEEVINRREVLRDGAVLCRPCADSPYYRLECVPRVPDIASLRA